MREGSAGQGATSWSGTFEGAACRLTDRRALRRSTVAIFDEATGLLSSDRSELPLTLSRQHWRCPSSDVVQATEGSPLIGCGRWPRSLGRGFVDHACRRHTLLRQL